MHLTQDELILFYYGEAEEPAAVELHLDHCPACRAELQSLKRVLNVMNSHEAPARGPEYGAAVWRALEPRLSFKRAWWKRLATPRPFAAAAATAALAVCAFYLGRVTSPVPAGRVQSAAEVSAPVEVVRERILVVALGDHLERSQMLMVELTNTTGRSLIDMTQQRQWAEDLLGDNRLYRQAALRNGQPGVANVLEDLERVLMEVAHSPSRISTVRLREIQQRVEEQGILFKVRVLGTKVREQGGVPLLPSRKG